MRITTTEACKILGIGQKALPMAAKNLNWDVQRIGGAGKGCRAMYLESDVRALAADRKERHTPIKWERTSKSDEVRGNVEWADALTKWPTDKEIDARTSDVYRRKDLESVIDTRVFRRVNGKRLKALRKPAMSVVDHRGYSYP